MVPSSRGILTGLPESGRGSNRSPPGFASSSGIHSRMAGETSNDEFRMSKLGDEGKVDDGLPKSVEAEEELHFAGADDGAGALHGGLAAGALERVGAPDAEDEVAPERAHGAGGGFGWWRDDRRFLYGLFFVGGFLR